MADIELTRDYRWISDSAIDIIKDKDNELIDLKVKYADVLERYLDQKIKLMKLDMAFDILISNMCVDSSGGQLSIADEFFTEFLKTYMGDEWVNQKFNVD